MSAITVSPPVTPNSEFRREFETLSGVNTSACFQCQKCSNGCPLTFGMDLAPGKAVGYVNAFLLKFFCPAYIVLLIKTGFELNQGGNCLPVLPCLQEGLDHGGI